MNDPRADLHASSEHELPVREWIDFQSGSNEGSLYSGLRSNQSTRSRHLDQALDSRLEFIQCRKVEDRATLSPLACSAVESRRQDGEPHQLECISFVSGIEKGLELNDVRAPDFLGVAPSRQGCRQPASK